MVRLSRLGACLVAALAGGLGSSCRSSAPEPVGRPDVLLISLDTLRADTAREQMPGLVELANGGAWVDEVYSPIGFTLPAHATMLFSRGIEEHQVLHEHARIAPNEVGIAEVFREAGYRTVALVTNEWVKAEFGFDQGFDEYHLLPHAATYADRVVPRVLELFEARREDPRPIFVFAHFMDAHSDFSGQGTGSLPYYAPADLTADLDLGRADDFFCAAPEQCATLWLMAGQIGGETLDPAALELAKTLYDRGVRGLDRDLLPLWQGLERHGMDRLVLAVTSDHGEEFLEHGRTIHSQTYEETLAVPLVLRADGRLPAFAAPGPFGLADISPTIVSLAGLSAPQGWSGRSLFEASPSRPLLSRDKLYERWCVRTARWTALQPLPELDRPEELYDRTVDRAEVTNVAADHPEQLARLLEGLARAIVVDGTRHSGSSALDEEERSRLRALGYAD